MKIFEKHRIIQITGTNHTTSLIKILKNVKCICTVHSQKKYVSLKIVLFESFTFSPQHFWSNYNQKSGLTRSNSLNHPVHSIPQRHLFVLHEYSLWYYIRLNFCTSVITECCITDRNVVFRKNPEGREWGWTSILHDGVQSRSRQETRSKACLVCTRLQAPDVSDEPRCPPFFPLFRSVKTAQVARSIGNGDRPLSLLS